MNNEFPLSTRELLKQQRALVMPESPAMLLNMLMLPEAERLRVAGAVETIATLIDQFQSEHGPL